MWFLTINISYSKLRPKITENVTKESIDIGLDKCDARLMISAVMVELGSCFKVTSSKYNSL